MTPTEQLKLILEEKYISEDEEEYVVELKPPLSGEEIKQIEKQLPSGKLPAEITELLRFARGFEFNGLDEICFDGIRQFGLNEFFPCSVQLAGDGYGNFWILDIDSKGNWGNVFYVSHQPPVIVKHSENLSGFIQHIDEFGKKASESNLDRIHERIVSEIWNRNNEFIETDVAKSTEDTVLKDFAFSLPAGFVIADLRNKPIQSGFAWGRFGPGISKTIRHQTELLWGIEKPVKRSFLSRLFNR